MFLCQTMPARGESGMRSTASGKAAEFEALPWYQVRGEQ